MFIGHLPAGYCLTTVLLRGANITLRKFILFIGLTASILPDVDMLYFYCIDQRQHFHHCYWTHVPIFWIAGALGLITLAVLIRLGALIWGTFIGFANVMTHLILDTVASNIRWLYPLSKAGFAIFTVPANHGWWIYNHLFHWTFGFEVALVIIAGYMFYYRNRQPSYTWGKGYP